MAHLNEHFEKQERICTTPQRMRLVESIKKSIHRSIQKINPNDYKHILKGQIIFMHLCYGGQIINSQYTRVALFMGGSILKTVKQKVTVVVTNDLSNKQVKKFITMGKPIVSVLWLQACFQQKRKVQYESFFFQEEPNEKGLQTQKEQQISVNFQTLLNLHKLQVDTFEDEFIKNHNINFLRFVDKKEKIDHKKFQLIQIHEIEIKCQKQRKSQLIIDKAQKKRNKKNEVKLSMYPKNGESSEVKKQHEQNYNSQYEINYSKKQKCEEEQNNSKSRLSKKIYQKYINDFNNYESKMCQNKNNHKGQQTQNIQGKSTPSFTNVLQYGQQCKSQSNFTNKYTETPHKINDGRKEEMVQTQSMKKSTNDNVKLSIIHPMISQQIQKINQERELNGLPLIQILGSDIRNLTWVICYESKIEAILALLSQPRIIVNEGFVKHMQENPCIAVTDEMLKLYEVQCQLNYKNIEGKKVILLDSVMGASSLQKIITQCHAQVVSSREYLLGLVKVDITITNKKQFMKNPNDVVMSQANFIDSLLVIHTK